MYASKPFVTLLPSLFEASCFSESGWWFEFHGKVDWIRDYAGRESIGRS
jgi:hypothetical protein